MMFDIVLFQIPDQSKCQTVPRLIKIYMGPRRCTRQAVLPAAVTRLPTMLYFAWKRASQSRRLSSSNLPRPACSGGAAVGWKPDIATALPPLQLLDLMGRLSHTWSCQGVRLRNVGMALQDPPILRTALQFSQTLESTPLALQIIVAVGGVCGLQRQRPGALPPRKWVHAIRPIELSACTGRQRPQPVSIAMPWRQSHDAAGHAVPENYSHAHIRST